jgi:CRISPR-associated protein Cmr5
MANGIVNKLENSRAEFAYNCVQEVILFKISQDRNFLKNHFSFEEVLKKKYIEKNDKQKEDKEKEIKEFITSSNRDFKKLKFIKSDFINSFSKDYKSHVKKIPMLIKTNGLGATLGFIKSKAKQDYNAYQLIYLQLTEWLKSDKGGTFLSDDENDLIAKVISIRSVEYKQITVETLALFNWLKRFVDGFIEGEDDE